MAESKDLFKGKNHSIYGLSNLNIYYIKKKKIKSFLKNKYYKH